MLIYKSTRFIRASMLVVVVMLYTTQSFADQWYSNGSLHSVSTTSWNSAQYANKLATSADWVVAVSPRIKKKVMSSGTLNTLKPYAVQMMNCVDQAASTPSRNVGSLAAACAILMGWN